MLPLHFSHRVKQKRRTEEQNYVEMAKKYKLEELKCFSLKNEVHFNELVCQLPGDRFK